MTDELHLKKALNFVVCSQIEVDTAAKTLQ